MGIEIHNITKTFCGKKGGYYTVLRDVSFAIESGEMVAIRGKSGAGKSTLMQIIGLLDSQTSGRYFLDGIDVSELGQKQRAKYRNEKFGYVFQDFALLEEETVIDNIVLPTLFSSRPSLREAKAKANDYLKNFNLEQLKNRQVATLSGGEKQRIAIIRALINDPPYILADEPTGALDNKNTDEVIKIFKSLNKLGKTILLITHDDYVSSNCPKQLIISDGCII